MSTVTFPTPAGGGAVRSDEAGANAIGSSASPVTLGADTYEAQAGFTPTRDFRDCAWHVTIPNKGTATKVTVKVEWSEDSSNLSQQGSELIAAGVSVLSAFVQEYDVSALVAPFNLPALLLPTTAPNAKVSVKADIGTTTTVYVRAWRKA